MHVSGDDGRPKSVAVEASLLFAKDGRRGAAPILGGPLSAVEPRQAVEGAIPTRTAAGEGIPAQVITGPSKGVGAQDVDVWAVLAIRVA